MDIEYLLSQLKEIEHRKEELPKFGPCECEHHLDIRIRINGSGEHHVYQCQNCGEQRGGSIARKQALSILKGAEAKPFDKSIEETKQNETSALLDEERALLDEERRINDLLNGVQHRECHYSLQKEQIEASNNQLTTIIEEFVGKHGQVKTLEALKNKIMEIKKIQRRELLVSINRFTSEDEVKAFLISFFSSDFHISEEVQGRHLAANVAVRIDFILTPRRHLIESGYDPAPFGVEAKYFKQESGFTHKTSRAFWQSISYNDCEFEFNNQRIMLKYCLLFSNLSFEQELALVKSYGHNLENDQIEWHGMIHLANHANVGILQVSGSKDVPKGWVVKFAGGIYFYRRHYNGKLQYYKSNENVINKVRVGNF